MIEVREASDSDRSAWSELVKHSSNGTIFHTPEFLDYHPAGRFRNHHLVLESSGRLRSLMTGALSERDGGVWLRSYPGASWGGPLLDDGDGLDDVEDIVDAIVEYCRARGFAGIEMTLPPQAYFRRPGNNLDFALLRRGFTYRKRELTAVIDLSRMGDDIELAFSDAAGRGVARARRLGLAVVEDPDFSLFYPVLETNLKDRHGVRPTHTLEELERLRSLVGRDRIRQFLAKGPDGVLAGMVMFHCNPRVSLAFYISHDARFQSQRPVNLLYREVIAWARDSGYRFLDLGTFTLDMEVNRGLCRFKESFSARGHFRDTLALGLAGSGV
ncbi:GNAT family N-acetyltransferase [Candidatus Fermentibacteria bacterium]|nr:GNAT family N-acetyltransferase [Candidatus Fermentibacteria bacterium]